MVTYAEVAKAVGAKPYIDSNYRADNPVRLEIASFQPLGGGLNPYGTLPYGTQYILHLYQQDGDFGALESKVQQAMASLRPYIHDFENWSCGFDFTEDATALVAIIDFVGQNEIPE